MVQAKSNSTYKVICISALVITLVLSPNVNKDSLIIPKIALLFLLALYLLPKIILSSNTFLKVKELKILTIIILLIIIQLLIVFLTSSAPIEQQLYGRTGRGLGLFTQLSILIILIASATFMKISDLNFTIKLLTISAIITSTYSIFQSFGIDFLKWDSRTNGVIGTLGNPNFQSTFAAMALIPAIFAFGRTKYRYLYALVSSIILLLTIYRTQSTQGYVGSALAVCTITIIFLWYKNRILSTLAVLASTVVGILAVLGMLNYGPLKLFLYKTR